MPGPEADLALLAAAVQAAGAVAMRYWRHQPRSWDKPGGAGPVSEADLAVNAALEQQLRAARPDYGWLSEESVDDPSVRHQAARCFIVDPIDGTRSFIAGENSFAIVAGIAEGGRMRAGAVWLPALRRLYTAHAAGPALCDGVAIRASGASDPDHASMLTTAPNLRADHWPGGVPLIRRAFRPSLAYRLCLVAEGRFDAMASFRPTWEWDIAAAALIAARAGAAVTDGDGGPLAFNRQARPQVAGVLAAAPQLHAALIARHRAPPGANPLKPGAMPPK